MAYNPIDDLNLIIRELRNAETANTRKAKEGSLNAVLEAVKRLQDSPYRGLTKEQQERFNKEAAAARKL